MKKRNIIKTGLLKSINEDQHTCEVSYSGKDYEAVFFSPFGLYSYPDNKIPCLILQINGDEDNLVAIPYDPDNRPTLEKGDVGLATSNGKMSVVLHKDGKIEIKGTTSEMIALISEALGYIQDTATNLASTTVPTALGASSLSSAGLFGTMAGNAGTLKGKFDAMGRV